MKLIVGITPQKEFPLEDLSADNASMLSLLLANQEIRTFGHDQAERFWLYWAGHRAMLAAGKHLDNADRVGAFSHGIATYEAIGLLLRPTISAEGLSAEHVGPVGLNVDGVNALFTLFEEAGEGFKAMPNTAGVVAETAEYAYPQLGSYAVYGAALARQLELEVV